MLKNKMLRRGCLSLALLMLAGVIALWGFVGLRTAKLAKFADDNRKAVERVRAMVARAARPAEETTATTQSDQSGPATHSLQPPSAPARADQPTTPGELAAQLWKIDQAINYNELRASPLTRNGGEVGCVTLGLPASVKYFTPGADGRFAPTAEAWRIIHEELALAEGGWQYIRNKQTEQDIKHAHLKSPGIAAVALSTTTSSATTSISAATSGTQPAGADQLVEQRNNRILTGLNETAQLLDRPAVAVPETGSWRTLPTFFFDRLAPAAIWRTSQRDGADAAMGQLEHYLRLQQALTLCEFPGERIGRHNASDQALLLQRLLAQLGADDRFDTPTLTRLARRLDGLRLGERQLTDLRQAHVVRLRQWIDTQLFSGGLVGYQDQPRSTLQKGARQTMLSFFTAYLQRGALAWVRGDEAEYYQALTEFDRESDKPGYRRVVGQLKLFFQDIMMSVCPPEIGAWNGEGAVNENIDLTRLLLAAIRFRRERGREPVSLAELTLTYLTGPEWRETADSVWAVDRPGTTTVPLIASPAGPDAASSFTQAVARFRKAERATPRSVEQLRRYAASPAEAQGFGWRFAPVPGRTLLCHFRHTRLHRKEYLGFEGMNSLVTDYHLLWNGWQVAEVLGPLTDLGEVENPLRAGTEQVDTIAITVIWPQPEL